MILDPGKNIQIRTLKTQNHTSYRIDDQKYYHRISGKKRSGLSKPNKSKHFYFFSFGGPGFSMKTDFI